MPVMRGALSSSVPPCPGRRLRASGPVYERAGEQGRLLPEGLRYIDSWVVDDGRLDRCFALTLSATGEN
jgi:hypothetical protein